MTIGRVVTVVAFLIACSAHPLAYLRFALDINGRSAPVVWNAAPVRWYSTTASVPNVSSVAFQAAVERAFDTWQRVPTASIGFGFAGFTGASPSDEDGLTVLGFEDQADMDRVLGATSFTIDDVTGEIIEADIFFNSAFPWSTAESGEAGRFDLQSIATHEIGHLLGLGHSAIGETELQPSGARRVVAAASVMFPIAFAPGNTTDRVLQPDDIAGVSDLYPDAGFKQQTGSISGRVTLNGRPVFGAHVTAFHLQSGQLVGGFSLDAAGRFDIAGLQPGAHVIRAEPLDDADLDSFFDVDGIELAFRPTIHSQIIAVPSGGATSQVTVAVSPK